MKNLITTITIITTIALLQACKRDDTSCGDQSDIIEIKNITNENKAKIPYTGTDTLVFISNTGDTATLLGKGKNIYYETVNNNLGTNECQRKYIGKYENYEINYSTNNSDFKTLKYKIYNFVNGQLYPDRIEVNINNEISTRDAYDVNNSANYKDSVLINGIYYKGIYLLGKNNILYSLGYGIIRLKFSNGKEYLKAK